MSVRDAYRTESQGKWKDSRQSLIDTDPLKET
jgi:hypothetical protein